MTEFQRANKHLGWKGGKKIRRIIGKKPVVMCYCPEHPFYKDVYMPEHRMIAENTLERLLPKSAVVHHVNGDSLNNNHNNLVVCEDDAYHKLLHLRTDALKSTGDPKARRCSICGEWIKSTDPNLVVYARRARPKGNGRAFHRDCINRYQRKRRTNRCK